MFPTAIYAHWFVLVYFPWAIFGDMAFHRAVPANFGFFTLVAFMFQAETLTALGNDIIVRYPTSSYTDVYKTINDILVLL